MSLKEHLLLMYNNIQGFYERSASVPDLTPSDFFYLGLIKGASLP